MDGGDSQRVAGGCRVGMTELHRDPLENFTYFVAGSSPTIVAARNGNGLQCASSLAEGTLLIPAAWRNEWTMVGFAFKPTTLVAGAEVVQYRNRTTSGDVPNPDCTLVLQASGLLQFNRSSTNVLASSATGVIVANTWHYVEMYVRCSDTVGQGIVRVNGTEVINVSGVDTKGTAAGTPALHSDIRLAPKISSATHQYDDFYLKVGAGETFNGSVVVPVSATSLGRTARQAIHVLRGNPAPEAPLTWPTHNIARHAVHVLRSSTILEPTCIDVLTEPFDNLSAWSNAGYSIVAARTATGARGTGFSQCTYTIPAPPNRPWSLSVRRSSSAHFPATSACSSS